jgi:ATP-binding cassette, subfamily F, member 3
MALASLSHITMNFSGTPLLHDVTLDVEPGRKVGIVGQNGVGKSTLLRLFAQQIEPHEGQVFLQRGCRVAYQEQELDFDPESTVTDELRRVFAIDDARAARLTKLEETLASELSEGEQRRLLGEYERLTNEHIAADSYDIDRRIEEVMSRLGLPESSWNQPMLAFSGGERNVIGLARVLLARPDVLLLDEPSNHLDMEGIDWFIEFLRGYQGSVLMVSHDRHLLDATADFIWEIERRDVTAWTGNYSDYQRQKDEALALQQRQFKVQQRLIRRLEFQARRLRDMARAYDDPGQAKRAKAMQRRVEQMDIVEAPNRSEQRFHASLAGADRHGRIALNIAGFSFSYGERELLKDLSLEIEYGDRVCLVGPNGSGKSTLFGQILDKAHWENPVLRLGKAATVGAYHQFHAEFPPRTSLLDWAYEMTGLPIPQTAALLHRFLFSRDDLQRPITTLSGGEKSRLQLARLVHEKVNFLLMDEPTNHLDIQACEQLEEMLLEYDGTLLIISHDRYFLDKLVDRVVEIDDRRLRDFRGTFGAWWLDKKARGASRQQALELRSQKAAGKDHRGDAQASREARKAEQRRQRRFRNELKNLERDIEALEHDKTAIAERLEGAYADSASHEEATRLTRDYAALETKLSELYARWEHVAQRVEQG